MLKNKLYVGIVIGLLFGICISMSLKGAGNVIDGIGHWSHDTDNDFLVPINESVDISLNNNSLIYANLSLFAGSNINWNPTTMQFDGQAGGGGVGDPWFNATDTEAELEAHITDVSDIYTDNDFTANYLNWDLSFIHIGDPWFNVTDTESELESHLTDVSDIFTDNDGALNDDDVTLGDVQSACSNDFHGIGGVDDDVPDSGDLGIIDTEAEFESELFAILVPGEEGGTSLWNDNGTTLFPSTDGRNIQINGSGDGDILINNSNISSTETLTLGNPDDDIIMCNSVYPNESEVHDIGTSNFWFKDLYLSGKIYVNGTVDPPCILFNKETLANILRLIERDIPKDDDKLYGGLVQWGDGVNMFAINPLTKHMEQFVWKSDYDLLEQRVLLLEKQMLELIG